MGRAGGITPGWQAVFDYRLSFAAGVLIAEIEGKSVLINTAAPNSIAQEPEWLFLNEVYPFQPESSGITCEGPSKALGTWVDVMGAKGFSRVYKPQRPVAELAVVADSFHVKPLIRILQSADRYQVLGLSQQEIRLFEGNRDAMDEIELHQDVPRKLTDALGEELTDSHLTVASSGGIGGSQSSMHHGHGGKKAEVDKDTERFFASLTKESLSITLNHRAYR